MSDITEWVNAQRPPESTRMTWVRRSTWGVLTKTDETTAFCRCCWWQRTFPTREIARHALAQHLWTWRARDRDRKVHRKVTADDAALERMIQFR